ncbi:DEAD_2 protein, partial [Halorientalis regularis]
KGNYDCIHPDVADNIPVHEAPCNLQDDFECDHKHRCPYYEDRDFAENGRFAAMTLALFLESAITGIFEDRDVIVIDEAHGLPKWAEMYGSITLGPDTVPNWNRIPTPSVNSITDAAQFAGHINAELEQTRIDLKGKPNLNPDEGAQLNETERLLRDLSWFLNEYHNSDTETEWHVSQGEDGAVTVKPINPERLLYHTLWDRGNKFALLSATILSRRSFCHEVGLNPDRVALVDIDHTFPLEHRPLYDIMQGKMTMDERDETIPDIAEAIAKVMAKHPDEKGLIHCHSYGIQDQLYAHLADIVGTSRLRDHDSANRDPALADWKRSSDPDVFLSVKMEEALDLKDDLARWQVLCKAPYPNTQDPTVDKRVNGNDDWRWYFGTTLATVMQACGRVVRSPDDWGATYVADTSFEDLFNRTRPRMPSWFREQVEAMEQPDLPQIAQH